MERHRDAHAERAEDALRHDEDRLAEAGEIAHEAEQERGQQTVDGVGLEIVCRLENDGPVVCEDPGEQIAVEEIEVKRGCGQKVGLQREATECTQKSRKKWRSENTSDWDR